MNINRCNACERYFDGDEMETTTIRGGSEYPGGPQMEPDETLHFCPHCGAEGDAMEMSDLELIEVLNDLMDELEKKA